MHTVEVIDKSVCSLIHACPVGRWGCVQAEGGQVSVCRWTGRYVHVCR